MNRESTTSQRRLPGLLLPVVIALMLSGIMSLSSSDRTSAHSDPADCTFTGVTLLLGVFEDDGTTPATEASAGDTLNYRAILSHIGPPQCNYEGGTLTITTPDGVVHDVTPVGGIPLVSQGNPFESDLVPYVADGAHVVNGALNASATYADGISHFGPTEVSPVGATTPTTTPFVTNPSTGVTAGVDIDVVVVGNEVTLTITETNDGDVDLTSPFVDLQPLGLTLTDTSTEFIGGDDNLDGILNPGETWTWEVIDTPAASTTYVAIGHGMTPDGDDVTWCEDPEAPPEGVICDQDERAEVSVAVIDPSTAVSVGVDLDVIVVGGEVTLTITETNDGDVDLTGPFVDLQPLGLTLTDASPEFIGGDDNLDGILNPGETWTWEVMDTPAATTTYVAIGHGFAPTGEEVTWCEDPEAPPEGVLCDQDERAEVTVEVTENPAISIVKTANDAADGTVLEIEPGAFVTFHYEVCNTGDVELVDAVVTDDNGTPGDTSDDFTVMVEGSLAVDACTTVSSDPVEIIDAPTCDETRLNIGTVVAFSVPFGTEVMASDDAELCAPPVIIGDEGCSPGYWKNHTEAWVGYMPDDTVGSVFADAPASLAGDTLLQALRYGGGPGADGGAKILLRAAVASLLNAAHPEVNFTMSEIEVIDAVNAALASGDRKMMLELAGELDTDNNLGCPF